MKLKLSIFLISLFSFLSFVQITKAQDIPVPQETFEKAQVIKITSDGVKEIAGFKTNFQDLTLKILDEPDMGKEINLEYGGQIQITKEQKVHEGDTVILSKTVTPDGPTYVITDTYRLNYLPYLFALFFLILILVAGKKGLGSVLGLVISLAVILKFIIPQIINGADPLLVSIIGSVAIVLITTYLAHGISRQTTLALIATFIALIIAASLSIFAVKLTSLAGIGDEEAVSLLLAGKTSNLNLQGLLLGGIIIGTLGALNDITTTQVAAIFELKKTDKHLNFTKLITKASSIGREHAVSLVNTLILAYAGSSLAIFIFFLINPGNYPLWVIINSEIIMDEVVRSLAGTVGLILAIPIVNILACWYITKDHV